MSTNILNCTVIIPNHNYAQWLPSAINSVLDQNYPNLNICVIDDGSWDNSLQAAFTHLNVEHQYSNIFEGQIEDKFGNIINTYLIRNKEAYGPSYARNAGIRYLWNKTDVFAFLDSDDYYHKNKLTESMKKIAEHDEIGIVYSDFSTIHQDGTMFFQPRPPFDRQVLVGECIINPNSLVRKSALETCGMFDEQLRTCEDYDLWLRITESFMAVHIPENLVTMRIHSNNSSNTVSKENWQRNYSYVMQKLMQRNGGQIQ